MNRLAIAAVLAVSTFASSQALAEEPSHAPTQDPQAQDEAPASAKQSVSQDEGFAGSVSVGLLAPGGEVADGVSMMGGALSFEARAGWFFSKHVGVLGGIRYAIGHEMDGCDASTDCSGHSIQLPVMVELDLKHRTEGAYVELGLGFFSQYTTSVGDTSLTATSPADEGRRRLPAADRRRPGEGHGLFVRHARGPRRGPVHGHRGDGRRSVRRGGHRRRQALLAPDGLDRRRLRLLSRTEPAPLEFVSVSGAGVESNLVRLA